MLILASASARRAELLSAAGIPFTVQVADVDESIHADETAEPYVIRVARDKAAVVHCRIPGKPILAADTTVVAEGRILGKPVDRDEARSMLERLSGRVHDVLTGVVLRAEGRAWEAVERTRVRFLPLSNHEITWYIATGEPDGKAGAYAIQGLASRFIDRVEGSYSNVVGLPVATVYGLLRSARLL